MIDGEEDAALGFVRDLIEKPGPLAVTFRKSQTAVTQGARVVSIVTHGCVVVDRRGDPAQPTRMVDQSPYETAVRMEPNGTSLEPGNLPLVRPFYRVKLQVPTREPRHETVR